MQHFDVGELEGGRDRERLVHEPPGAEAVQVEDEGVRAERFDVEPVAGEDHPAQDDEPLGAVIPAARHSSVSSCPLRRRGFGEGVSVAGLTGGEQGASRVGHHRPSGAAPRSSSAASRARASRASCRQRRAEPARRRAIRDRAAKASTTSA